VADPKKKVPAMEEPIRLAEDATPEEVARAILQTPPKKKWRYVKGQEKSEEE
jgi:hypothetical protein